VGHALVDDCSAQQACAAIILHARQKSHPAYVITPNAQHVVLLEKDPRFRQVYRDADLVVPDGMSILIAARLYGRSLKERVTGVDIFQTLCARAAETGLHVFLLGGRQGSAEKTASVLLDKFPNLRISTYCPPWGFEQTAEGLEATASQVRAAAPDLLFVALGAPKQEYWIYEHGLRLGVPICVGVGGTFEIVGGIVPRAPSWMRDAGFEWLYRLCAEPSRMWRRYLLGNVEFAWIVLKQGLRRIYLGMFLRLMDKGSFAAELREAGLLRGDHVLESLATVKAGAVPEPQHNNT